MNDREFELLDSYLKRLHEGTPADRDELLAAHPELKSAVRCLEALEKLAPPSAPSVRKPASGQEPTLASSRGQTAAQPAEAKPIATREFGDYELLEEIARGVGTRAVLSRGKAHPLRDSTPGRGLISTSNVVLFTLIRFVEDLYHLVARELNLCPIPVPRFGANNDFKIGRAHV